MNVSRAAFLASKSSEDRAWCLEGLTEQEKKALEWCWKFWAHPNQLAPSDDWDTWLFLAGRGAGKTRAGAEWVRKRVKEGARHVALVAPTTADTRKVMVEGDSGILSVCWENDRTTEGILTGLPTYEPSNREVKWANGAIATTYSAEEPRRLRGPQHDTMWADELGAWERGRETWDMAMFGLRMGARPQVMVTTTPKPLSLLREILDDPLTVVSRGTTFDNAANLAPAFLRRVLEKYRGTRLGRQELYAEMLEEAEGALWTRDMLEKARYQGEPPEMKRIVVSIDPAITAKAESDETGIVAAGLGVDDQGYVLEDVSGRYSPGKWAKVAIELFKDIGADRIIAEANQGGDMVRHTLNTEWPGCPITMVWASRGKRARAEPVAALYEQGRVKHVGALADLEDQLVNWEPLGGQESPDRLDALVWAMTSLMITKQSSTSADAVKGGY